MSPNVWISLQIKAAEKPQNALMYTRRKS